MFAAIAVIGSFFSAAFLRFVFIFIAGKVLLIALMVTVLPIVLNNVFHSMIERSMEFMTANTNLIESPLTYQASGLMAYFVDSLFLPECLAMTLSALSVRFSLRIMRII